MTNKRKFTEYLVIFTIISGIMFIFMGLSGVISSGYHIMDDEDIYAWTNEFYKPYGFWNGFWKRLLADIGEAGRFRYTWVMIRWIQIRIFGDNMVIWHIYQTLFDSFVLFLIYVLINKLKISRIYYVIFVFILYVGYQSEVLWDLGPQENIGLFFLSLSLICWISYNDNPTMLSGIKLCTSLFFLAGAKESFLILLPILPFISLYFCYRNSETLQLKLFLKNNKIIIAYIYIMFFLCIFKIYTNTAGESGEIKNNGSIKPIILMLKNNLCEGLKIYAAAGIVAILIIIICLRKYSKIEKLKLLFLIFIMIYVISSQLLVHMNKLISLRYLIPTTYFFALFFVLVWNDILKNKRTLLLITIILVCGIVGYGNRNAMRFAKVYADDGKSLDKVFNDIKENIKEGDTVLLLADLEGSYAMRLYLENTSGINGVNYYERKGVSVDEADIICINTVMDEYSYIYEQVESPELWTTYEEGVYKVFVKK